ncbi:Predicted hydrolase of the alpha/beta-hydrolase fold [Pseudoalteromonas luteoviolacea B = ATCC 29581]|nr:Predicted hydrolase of the alpha/beta-hydrolase fold [Pseudoalteromonas luteoviolacea B = ATCC 29581]
MALIKDNANKPIANLVLAHGAGAGSDSDFMVDIAKQVAKRGVNVARFDFDYMQLAKAQNKRRPPDRAPKLLDCFKRHLTELDNNLPCFIAGKSMGGRMATLLAAEGIDNVSGVIALGYPFHPPGKPEKLRTEHFSDIHLPFHIIQGERDTFGNKDFVSRLNLPSSLEIHWLEDGDHSFKPRKASGFSESMHRERAAEIIVTFIQETLK